ncbi:MAG: hypothetical protein OXC31_15400 [Spirochaetaceae bacterium]|nr:hypothetical protein [Spirochaetaceae bacterium]
MLESSLIRHHRPRLNRADPRDLGLWHLRLSPGPFPRLERVRPDATESSDPGTLERGAVPQAVLRPGGGDAAVACARRLQDGRFLVATLRVRGGALVALSRVDAGAGATPAEARRAALAPATHGLHHPVVIADTPAGSAGGGWVEPDLARGLLELARINLAYHPAPAPAA